MPPVSPSTPGHDRRSIVDPPAGAIVPGAAPKSLGRAGHVGAVLLMVGLGALVTLALVGLREHLDPSGPARFGSVPVALAEAPSIDDVAGPGQAAAGPRSLESAERVNVPPGSLSPSTVTDSDPPPADRAELATWALNRIEFPWRQTLPGWEIEFLGERPGLYGLTLVDQRRIEIYVRDDQDPELLVHIVAHEIGHAIDVTFNSGSDRRSWQRARAIESEPWWPDAAASDFATGAGDFAEAFAHWQAGPEHFRSTIAPPPTDEQLQLLARLAADR